MNPSRKRYLSLALKLVIVAIVLFGVRRSLLAGLTELDRHSWQLDPFWLLASGSLYLVSLVPAGLFWRRVLQVMGQDAQLGETLRAYFIGHLGKYVPGKALVVILRAGLIRSHRVDPLVAGTSVFVETLTMMSVGAFLAAAIIPIWFGGRLEFVIGALVLMAMAGLPTFPPIFRRAIRWTPMIRSNPARLDALDRLRGTTLLSGWITMGLGWFVTGLSLWAVLKALGAHSADPVAQLPLFTATAAMATVAGFLSMIPGGVVVREAVLAEMLADSFGASTAWLAAIVCRLVWLVAEALISAILYFVGLRAREPLEAHFAPPEENRPDVVHRDSGIQ